jgi:hypothetical protein
MLLAADLCLQRFLDVPNVGLMVLVCLNEIEIVLFARAKVDDGGAVLIRSLGGHSGHTGGRDP